MKWTGGHPLEIQSETKWHWNYNEFLLENMSHWADSGVCFKFHCILCASLCFSYPFSDFVNLSTYVVGVMAFIIFSSVLEQQLKLNPQIF